MESIEEELLKMKKALLKFRAKNTPEGPKEGFEVSVVKDLLLLNSIIPLEKDVISLIKNLLKEGHCILVTEEKPKNKYYIVYEEKTDKFSNWRQINSV